MTVILFDGVCNLCNGAVNWLIKHDQKNVFKFASLQSDFGKGVIRKNRLQDQYMDSIVLIEDEVLSLRAVAVLKILSRLGGIFRLADIFLFLPAPILNFFYNIVAKYRYSWFGQRKTCRIPDPGLKEKFIE